MHVCAGTVYPVGATATLLATSLHLRLHIFARGGTLILGGQGKQGTVRMLRPGETALLGTQTN